MFEDFLTMFHVHFVFAKPDSFQDKGGLVKYFEWADVQYSQFMIKVLQALEPRIFSHG